MRLTEQEYQDLVNRKRDPLKAPAAPAKPSKFHNVISECDGIKFHSKKERKYYLDLKARVHMGEIKYFLMQVPIRTSCGVKYVVDFIEFHANGSVHYTDVKGMRTKEYKIKRKLVESEYPIIIEEA